MTMRECTKHEGVEIQWDPQTRNDCPLCTVEQHSLRRPPITFVNPRRKPLAEVMGEDIPQGLSAEDVATDYPQRPWK